MSTVVIFVLGVAVGALIYREFGAWVVKKVFRGEPRFWRKILRGLSPDGFNALRDQVLTEDKRRKTL